MGSPLVIPYSNPLAQAWRLPSFESPRVNLRWEYGKTFTVAAGTTVPNNIIPIEGSAPFLWREVAFNIGASAPGKIFARFRDGRGKKLSADLLSVEELAGPIPISQLLPRTSQLFVDIQNTGVGSIDVQVILKGIQLYQRLGINDCMPGFDPEDYTPLYKMYSRPAVGEFDEPFDYYFEIAATALQNQTVVLPMESDADFYWRSMTAAYTGAGLQKFQFADAWDNSLSSDFVLQTNAFGLAPMGRPLGPPEVCCPAYSALTVRAVEYANDTTTAKIVLRGVKRFKSR